MDPLLQLIRIFMGRAKCIDRPFSDTEWENILKVSKKQSVIGIVYKAMMALPEDMMPSRRIKVQLGLCAEKIENRNILLDKCSREITGSFKNLGYRSCVLKGQGTALLYPDPHMRQCGDIDLWVEGLRDDILASISEKWQAKGTCYHHTAIFPFDNIKVEVEVHFHPTWMYDPLHNRKLLRFFEQGAGQQFDNLIFDKGFSVPVPYFNCVFSLIHIYRHLLLDGIGLRQYMDYCVILEHSSSEDRISAMKTLERLGMKRFAAATMYVMEKVFAMPDNFRLCPPDEKYGTKLLDEMMRSGNFGRYDDRNAQNKSESDFGRFFRRVRRIFRFFPIAPREVLWAPVFKVCHYIWRKSNKFI